MGHGPPGTLTCFPLNWWSVSKLLAGSPLATCCPTASALAPRPLPPGIFLLPLALASPANGAEVRGLPWTVLSQSPAWWEWRALGTRRGFSGAQNSRWEWYLLNLSRPIEEQGPLDVIIHKLTDVILEADQNDSQSLELVHRFQEYIDAHPETIVLDPLPAIRTLLDRSKSYELIRKIEAYMKDDRICSPPFMELTSLSGDDTMRLLEQNGLAFPFICKTRVAHGTNSHEMAIVFNQEGLSAIQPPCVVQNFINHNAVLYKVFVVGESYTVVQRPSLKNFSAGTSDRESIFFNSHNVSKPESSSVLTALDKIEGVFERPSDEVIRELSRALRQALGVSLFGIDIIINNQTGQHAVIDINAFPGYEGVSEFFTDLLNHVATVLQGQSAATAAAGDVAPLRHSRLLTEQAGGLAGERTCSAGPGCCSNLMGPDPPWTAEADAGGVGPGGTTKLPHQRLGCTAAVSPSFQQHCVASLATKASSQ
ncbi:inositol-tetrakisphosphate 1-kinase isoform X1 [Meles meles]|uniref:inositol-tetrakisphosphate 1-kinase isoform X1 n=1 Tax=Meles meles TaxID=9662 RepID=UPI001E69BCC2|nr:inositol-tetrakisphosphate 1-kinase isoform X1 [Meles meles]